MNPIEPPWLKLALAGAAALLIAAAAWWVTATYFRLQIADMEKLQQAKIVIAQDEASSVVWGMPGSAAHSGHCSAVLPLDEIAPKVVRLVNGDRL